LGVLGQKRWNGLRHETRHRLDPGRLFGVAFDRRSPIGGYPQLRQGALDAERRVVRMYEPNIGGNAARQAFKPGRHTARHQPRVLDEIDDGWIRVIDRAGSGIHPIFPPKANRALIYPACHVRKSIDPPRTLDPRVSDIRKSFHAERAEFNHGT